MTIKVFCINLDRSVERWSNMHDQFKRIGMDVERIKGVDGASNVPDWLEDQFKGAPLSSGEIGCYASHLVAAREIVTRGLDCSIILEDDALLNDDFVEASEAAIALAPDGWDYIHLSTDHKRPVIAVAQIMSHSHLIKHSRLPINEAAYILSESGARKRLKPRKRARPNDLDVRYGWLDDLQIYGVMPSPARQVVGLSEIDGSVCVGHLPQPGQEKAWLPPLSSRVYGLAWNARRIGISNIPRIWYSRTIAKRKTAML